MAEEKELDNNAEFVKPSQELIETIVKKIKSNTIEIVTQYFDESGQKEKINEKLKAKGYTESFESMVKTNDPRLYDIIIDLLQTVATDAFDKKNIQQSVQMGIPKYFISPNTKLSNLLQSGKVFTENKEEPVGIPVMNIGKPNETIIAVSATLENLDDFPIKGKSFTEFDRAVHDAIASMYNDRVKNGILPIFTADMIYRTMTHKTENERVSPQQRASITKSLNKMRKNIYITADCTEEFKRKGIVVNQEGKTDSERYYFVMDDFLLSAKHFKKMTVGGGTVDAYLFNEPLLLEYARLTKQLITVNGEIFRIQEVDRTGKIKKDVFIPDTENRIAAKSYLSRRIEIMRHDEKEATKKLQKYNKTQEKHKEMPTKKISDFYKQSRTIDFDTLFSEIGIDSADTKTNMRNYILQVLDYWKAVKHITNYSVRKKGKAINAICIRL